MSFDLSAKNATSASRVDLWQAVWRIVTGNQLLAFVMAALALLLLLAALLPQAPSSTDDLAAYSRWLALAQQRFGQASNLLQTLGLFSITHTLVLRLLAGLIACALAARLVDCIENAWRGRTPSTPPSHTPSTILNQSLDTLTTPLRQRHWRVKEIENYVVIDRYPLPEATRIVAIVSALVLLIGLAITNTSGWNDNNIQIGVGEAVALRHALPYALRLDSLQQDGSGQLTMLKASDPVAGGPIAPGRGLNVVGLAIHLQDIGPAVRASATISDNRPLNLLAAVTALPSSELLLHFTSQEPERAFAAPEAGALVRMDWEPSSQSFHIVINQTPSGEALFEGELPPSGVIQVKNLTLKLALESYARLTITHDPGMWPTAMGGLLSALGLLGIWLWPARRTWLRATGDDQSEIIGDSLPLKPPPPEE